MDLFQAIVLGVVQGLTEFLPISSSGHLILVPVLLGWQEQSLSFDVVLHLGTMFAVLLYFWRDWWEMAVSLGRDVVAFGLKLGRFGFHSRLALLIGLGCIPAAVVGGLFDEYIETSFRSPLLVALMLVLISGVMWLAERWGSKREDLDGVGWKSALFIGVAQAVALIPGTSRSGVTISAGLFSGLERGAATRFSFLLATPVIAGAGALKLRSLASSGVASAEAVNLIVGFLVSLLVGLLTIRFMLRFLQVNTMSVFIWYRLVLGIIIAALSLFVLGF